MTFLSYHYVEVPTCCCIIIVVDSGSFLYTILLCECTKIFTYSSVDTLVQLIQVVCCYK